ncbi:hypothetical protein [Kocuria sp.]|uniref:hypothetical protein n=1 Tax=Kocuria sp. TaxID=1871328 RepID=UPI0026E05750|nr:hypothetical protein [Kocuria sp.]MDO5618458.1 hypothetical protein [Kocuria sp.]
MTGSDESPRGLRGRLRAGARLPWRRRPTSSVDGADPSPDRASGQAGTTNRKWRRWSRLLPLVIAVVAVVSTLAGILYLNIKISDGQYRLVELRAQERSLAQESEALTQDLEFYQAPQNLAIAATNDGMVPTTSEGLVDLQSQEVTGDPQPAAQSEDGEVLVAQPVQRGSAAADRAASLARERRDALPDTDTEVNDQLRAANQAESDVNLHGGSLPAPQQRQPADATASPSPTAVPTGAPASAGTESQANPDQSQPTPDQNAGGGQ